MYNEEHRIARVLRVLQKVAEIDEIICIDDASKDNTTTIVKKLFPHIPLYIHKKNAGKSAAIATGLAHTKHPAIFLCDADLQWLKARECSEAIQAFFGTKARMIILKRIEAALHIKAFRGNTLISGERILYKKDLQKILQKKNAWFALEVLLNKYMMDNDYPVYRMPSSAINTFKMSKYGLWKWLQKDRSMYQEMELFKNKFVQQVLMFCTQKAVPEKWIVEYVVDTITLQNSKTSKQKK
jgi:hypothetical protein